MLLLDYQNPYKHGCIAVFVEGCVCKILNLNAPCCPPLYLNVPSADPFLCRVNHAMALGLTVGLGTDVAGGISPSMLTAIRMAVVNSRCLRAHKLAVKVCVQVWLRWCKAVSNWAGEARCTLLKRHSWQVSSLGSESCVARPVYMVWLQACETAKCWGV